MTANEQLRPSARDIKDALRCGKAGCGCARQGGNVHCPGHDDREPSLSVGELGGKVLVRCFGGCGQEQVIGALREKGLWSPSGRGNGHSKQEGPKTPTVYEFRNVNGTVVALKGRFEPVGAPKYFLWKRPGSDRWDGLKGLALEDIPLWGAELLSSRPDELVFVVEGEKAAQALRDNGLLAVTFGGGASSERFGRAWEVLAGRDVVLWSDYDEPGFEYMGRVKVQLTVCAHLGTAPRSIKWINPDHPGKRKSSDAFDYFCVGNGTAEDLLALVEREPYVLGPRAPISGAGADAFESGGLGEETASPRFAASEQPHTEALVAAKSGPFVAADSLARESGESEVGWLPLLGQEGYVGRGLFTLLSARPKCGKTTLVAHVVKSWLEAGLRVGWLTEEPRAKWRQRITALGLDSPDLLIGFADGAGAAIWVERLRELKPDVIVLDTARAFLEIADENDAGLVHRALFPLVLAARDMNAALVGLHHRRKADGPEGVDIAGSHAYAAECDVAVILKEDPACPRRREIQARSRFDETPSRLLLELGWDGDYRALGAPEAVSFGDTKQRVRDLLSEEPQDTGTIWKNLPEPRLSREIVRQVLHRLVDEGVAVRIEGRGRQGDRWSLCVAASVVWGECSVVAATEPDLFDGGAVPEEGLA